MSKRVFIGVFNVNTGIFHKLVFEGIEKRGGGGASVCVVPLGLLAAWLVLGDGLHGLRLPQHALLLHNIHLKTSSSPSSYMLALLVLLGLVGRRLLAVVGEVADPLLATFLEYDSLGLFVLGPTARCSSRTPCRRTCSKATMFSSWRCERQTGV